jgi:hypothetical protein
MFPTIHTVETRVETVDGKDVVQFCNPETKQWEQDITLTYTCSGMAIFTLDTDDATEPYVFFGALQQVPRGSSPDTNWDFVINGEGNIITFTNNCKNKQNIGIKLTLIKRDAEDLVNALISADPIFKNRPD